MLGGYLSPGHDAYVRMKCGAGAIPASVRLMRCAEAVAGTWLSVDPWEALHRRVAVNFTDVAARLRAWLRRHVDPRVEVLYVCGGDNARFALAFAEEGGCVVVGRPGASQHFDRWRSALADNPRVLWADGDHPGASRAVRAPVWTPPPPPRLVLRLEDHRAVRTLNLSTWRLFQTRITEALSAVVRLRTIALESAHDGDDVISLDAMLGGRHTLALSRCFAPGGYTQLGHVARPGSPPLDAQVARIPDGRYLLRDDDRATGGTLAAAKALLRPAQVIVGTRVAVEHAPDEDVADSRDFLLGANDGGLVLAMADGRLGRAPYALPYVDPAARCSVPPEEARGFSEAVWRLNAEAFAGGELRVRHLPEAARAVADFLGDDTPLVDVCRWHLDALARTRPLSREGP